MKVQSILSKSLGIFTVFAMTFNMVLAQTLEVPTSISEEKVEVKTEEISNDKEAYFEEEVKNEESSKEEESEKTEEVKLEEGELIEAEAVFDETATEEVAVKAANNIVPPPVANASITVCKAIAKKVGDEIMIADASEVPGYTFTIPWVGKPATPGTEGLNAQPVINPDAVFTTDAFTPTKAFFGETPDSECIKFSNLTHGSYFYGQEEITGGDDSVTWTTKYSDQILLPVDAFEDVDEYNDNLFTSGLDLNLDPKGSIDADGYTFNTNADGHIVLNQSNAGRNRTIIVLNIFEENPRYCNVQENLVVNGGFEYPAAPNNSWDIFDNGTPGLGWAVEWRSDIAGAPEVAKLELHNGVNGWVSDEGNQHAELDTDYGSPAGGEASVRISQDIATIPGQYYELSYAFSPRPGTYEGENVLKVFINGDHEDTKSTGAYAGTNTSWTTYIIGFTATSSVTTIAFEDAGFPNSTGTFLDDVRVVCADEDDGGDDGNYEEFTLICHIPPGNPNNKKTQSVGSGDVQGHLNHGDHLGPCVEDETPQQTSGGSSGSSGSRSGGSVLGASTEGDVLGACVPFIEYHKKGDVGGEVARIQEFLNEEVNAGLTVNGVYDEATAKAVGVFQEKYSEQILNPWFPFFKKKATYRWYKTTKMMANEIIDCPESEVYLEDPKIMYKVQWNAELKQN